MRENLTYGLMRGKRAKALRPTLQFRWNPLLHKKALPGRIALRWKGRCRWSDPPQAENPASRILFYVNILRLDGVKM